MITIILTILITGTIMFYIGVFYGAYIMLKDLGMLPNQQQHYQSPNIMPGHQEEKRWW